MAALPAARGAAFALRHSDNLAAAEIARSLGISYTAAGSALSRARAKLTAIFSEGRVESNVETKDGSRKNKPKQPARVGKQLSPKLREAVRQVCREPLPEAVARLRRRQCSGRCLSIAAGRGRRRPDWTVQAFAASILLLGVATGTSPFDSRAAWPRPCPN